MKVLEKSGITNRVQDREGNFDIPYTFEITLDNTDTMTYGGIDYVDGVATVELTMAAPEMLIQIPRDANVMITELLDDTTPKPVWPERYQNFEYQTPVFYKVDAEGHKEEWDGSLDPDKLNVIKCYNVLKAPTLNPIAP